MTRFIEYYEIESTTGYEYYYMPVDREVKHRKNFDNRSVRIWKFEIGTDRIRTVMDRSTCAAEIDRAEFFKIQLMAKPVPFEDYYLQLQEMKRYREQHTASKSNTEDQV